MFRNKQATSKLVSGSLILISLSMQCTFFASASSAANSSISEYSNSVKSDKEKQVSNLSESSTNLTTKRPASDNIKTEATTTQFRFLDDYGELPELTHDYDDDDDEDILESVTTEPTTMKVMVHHHANEVRASLYQANPATTRIPDYVDSHAQALGQGILDEFADGSGDVTETNEPSTSISTILTTPTTTTTTSASSTSKSTTLTTPTTTTTAIATTSNQPITPTKPPDFGTVANVNMSYSLLILTPFDPILNDNSSTEYKNLAKDVEKSVNQAFLGCPGFKQGSAKVKFFEPSTVPISSGKYVLGNPSPLADGDSNTEANYTVTFDSATVYEQEDDIVEYIALNVTWNLESEMVGNYSVSADGMENSTRSQMAYPCSLMTSAICSPCYWCKGYATVQSLSCHFGCDMRFESCFIIENYEDHWEFECICKDGYLPIGGQCADEDVVIGVSAALISAFLLGLIIAFIILCIERSRKGEGSEISLSEAPLPYESPGPQEPSGPSPEPTIYSHPGPPLLPLAAILETEPSAPPESISLGEVVVAKKLEAAAPEPGPSTRSEVIVHAHSEDMNDQPLAKIELESHRLYDYDDEYDLPPEFAKSTVFRNFIPSLKNIEADDLGKEFAIARPRLSLPPFEAERDVSYNNETFF